MTTITLTGVQKPTRSLPVQWLGAVVLVALLVATSAGAEAAKPRLMTKRVSIPYTLGCSASADTGIYRVGEGGYTCNNAKLTLPAWTRYLTIAVKDQTGRTIGGEIYPKGGVGAQTQAFCGSSLKNYRTTSRFYYLNLDTPSVGLSCASAATTGTITVTYSNQPIR